MAEPSGHLPGYRRPLVPPGRIHRPKKGLGSYDRRKARKEIEEGLREWKIESIWEDDGYPD